MEHCWASVAVGLRRNRLAQALRQVVSGYVRESRVFSDACALRGLRACACVCACVCARAGAGACMCLGGG